MSKFNISKLKKAQVTQPASPAATGGYEAGAAMNAGQSIVSGTSLVDVMNDANLTNAAIKRNVVITNPSGPFVFLGPDQSGSGMAVIGVAPQALAIASNKKMKKKAGILSTIENIKRDAIESLIDTQGRNDQHYDAGDTESSIMGDVTRDLRKLGLDENDIDIAIGQIYKESKEVKLITHDDSNEDDMFQYDQRDPRDNDTDFDDFEDYKYKNKTNITSSSKIKKNASYFDEIERLKGEAIKNLTNIMMSRSINKEAPNREDSKKQVINNLNKNLYSIGADPQTIDNIMQEIYEELNNLDSSMLMYAMKKVAEEKNIDIKNLESFHGDINTIIVSNVGSDLMFKVAKSSLDKKFDKCVKDIKAKGGKGAKNPYAICMVSTGKGKKKDKEDKDKKASTNPFIKKSQIDPSGDTKQCPGCEREIGVSEYGDGKYCQNCVKLLTMPTKKERLLKEKSSSTNPFIKK